MIVVKWIIIKYKLTEPLKPAQNFYDWHNLASLKIMELVAGYPYWLIKNGLLYQYPKLLENTRTRVAIIGGGISGALTAYYLIKAGIECMVVDSRTIGLGSTCASTSLLQYELDIPLHKLKKIVGNYRAVRSYQLCGEAVDKLINLMGNIGFKDFTKRQSLYFSLRRKQKNFMKDELMARKEAGFAVELLSAEELKRHYNLKASYGILSEKGASNDAYALIHEIFQHCIQNGLKVFDRTKIKSIDYKKEKAILKTEEGCLITADYIVNATGYEVINFINKKIVNLDCTYAIISESQAEKNELWKNGAMMWNTDDPYLYLCPADQNRVMIGGRDESFINVKTMHRYLDKKATLLEKDFNKLFFSLSVKKEFAWSGVFGKTKDSLPFIGSFQKTPRTFYALGFGGNGITFSLVAAEIITDLLSGRKNKEADIFSFSR
jgi:glycine/D-amino acid oxidase-like deaminating enzyme